MQKRKHDTTYSRPDSKRTPKAKQITTQRKAQRKLKVEARTQQGAIR